MQVSAVMSHRPEIVDADASVAAAARQMRATMVGLLPVVSGGRLVGVVTDRDLAARALTAGGDARNLCVRDVMTRSLVVCHPEDAVEAAVARMVDHAVRRVVVVDRDTGAVAGVLSVDDLALVPERPEWALAVLRRTAERRVELDGLWAET